MAGRMSLKVRWPAFYNEIGRQDAAALHRSRYSGIFGSSFFRGDYHRIKSQFIAPLIIVPCSAIDPVELAKL